MRYALLASILLTSACDSPTATPEDGSSLVGKPAPELSGSTADGGAFDLASQKGKVVLIDFWASWCGPCREELPELRRIQAAHADAGLVVVGVNIDETRGAMEDFLTELPLDFPVVHDPEQSIAGRYQPPKMPSSYIVDRQGNLVHVHAGYKAGDAAKIEAKLVEVLAGP